MKIFEKLFAGGDDRHYRVEADKCDGHHSLSDYLASGHAALFRHLRRRKSESHFCQLFSQGLVHHPCRLAVGSTDELVFAGGSLSHHPSPVVSEICSEIQPPQSHGPFFLRRRSEGHPFPGGKYSGTLCLRIHSFTCRFHYRRCVRLLPGRLVDHVFPGRDQSGMEAASLQWAGHVQV